MLGLVPEQERGSHAERPVNLDVGRAAGGDPYDQIVEEVLGACLDGKGLIYSDLGTRVVRVRYTPANSVF